MGAACGHRQVVCWIDRGVWAQKHDPDLFDQAKIGVGLADLVRG